MRKFTVVLLLLAAILPFVSCNRNKVDHGGRTPLVEVDGNFLYVEDLQQVRPKTLTIDDSAHFTDNYIRNWIEEVLLKSKAQHNVENDREIDRLVENYRNSLITHTYQQRLMNEQLNSEIEDSEIEEYYRQHGDRFLLEYPVIKGLYIKVPINVKQANQIRQWYKQKDVSYIEKIEKLTLQYAVDYHYFYDDWIPAKEILDKMPQLTNSPNEYLKNHRQIELRDTASIYFLNIDSIRSVGERMPLDFARASIREELVSLKQVEFMKRIRKELYDEAVEDNEIIYYLQ